MNDFDTLRRLLEEDRSIRRFDASRPIGRDVLTQLVDLTRLCASGRNLQPLRYRPVDTAEERDALFPLLAWAGYLTDWAGPAPEERPTAYLVQCLNLSLAKNCLCDDGLQLQAITLGARALGIGACILKAFDPAKVAAALGIDTERFMPRYVVALGYPAEKVVLEDMEEADIKYWRSPDGTHHVPKRPLSELIIC
ncbi:MAG: nitroreductase family protein [Muribaculaceae bacterium]|nr:nitroreductase family protein [Muribaculaceae bacterium]